MNNNLLSIPLIYLLVLDLCVFESISKERVHATNFSFETNIPLPWSIFYTKKTSSVKKLYPDFRVLPSSFQVGDLSLFSVRDKFIKNKSAKIVIDKQTWNQVLNSEKYSCNLKKEEIK